MPQIMDDFQSFLDTFHAGMKGESCMQRQSHAVDEMDDAIGTRWQQLTCKARSLLFCCGAPAGISVMVFGVGAGFRGAATVTNLLAGAAAGAAVGSLARTAVWAGAPAAFVKGRAAPRGR